MSLMTMRGLMISRQLSKHCQKSTVEPKVSLLQINNKNMAKPCKISVEGNIGSGKTTFLNYFKRFPFVQTYDEPLDKWRNVQGHNLLRLLYEDMSKYNATFQSYVQLTRVQIQTSTPKDGIKVQIFERSVQNNRYCFMEDALKSGCLLPPQFSVLCEWFEWIQENIDISLDFIVYLRTSPDIVYKRVKERNRAEEKSISMEYMEAIHNAHENWLMDPKQKIPVFVVDANKGFDDVIESLQKNLPVLFNPDISSDYAFLEKIKAKEMFNKPKEEN